MDTEPRMAGALRLDLDALDARALEARPDEQFQMVSSGSDHRLGVVATASPRGGLAHSVELLISAFPARAELRPPMLERVMRLARYLSGRGYLLISEEGGWLSCSRTLPRGEVVSECEALMGAIMAFRADGQGTGDGAAR